MKKKCARRGRGTSGAEVTNIRRLGFWLLLEDGEMFVPFRHFPWFRKATIGQVLNVELPGPRHLYWPDLDIDLAVESIAHPERFPLVSRGEPNDPLRPTAGARSVPSVTRTRARRG